MGCGASISAARKEDLLRNTPFFLVASEFEEAKGLLHDLATAAVVKRFPENFSLEQIPKGTFIVIIVCPLEPLLSTVRPQIPKGTFIVIIEGELALEGLRVKGERNSRRTMAEEALAVRKAGDFFRVGAGGPAMKRSKAASMLADPVIRTTQSSVLLMLSPQALNKVLGRKAGEWVAMLQEMMNHDLYDLLGRVPCFAPLDDQLRSAIAQLFSFEVLAPGKTLFSEGDDGDRFCILLHGEVDVVCEGKKLVTRVPQAFIGEIALLYNCTRTSSVVSTGSVCSFLSLRKARSAVPRAEQPRMSPAHTLRLAQEHFSSMMERVPEMASIVEGQQRQRIVYQSMKQSGLYTEDDTEESTADHCAAMAPLMRVRSVCEGEEVLAEGAPPAQFYVVFQGRLAARRAGTTYMPGHHVGGDAMLLHHPHADTIVAQTAGLLLEVRGDQFFSLLELQPRLMCEFELRILASSTRLEAVLHLPRAFVAFSAFGKAEFAEENLQFYAAASAFAVIAERRLDQLAEETRDGASLRVSKKKRTSGANKSNVPKSLDSSPTLGALGAAFVASSFVKSADRDADVPARAAELVDLYIRDGADRQVNVPSAVQRAVEKSLAAADVTEVLFEAARLEIIALMRRDTFKRFVTTDEFTALRDEISAPEKTPCPAKGPLALPEARSAWQVAYGAVPEAQAAPTFKEELLERTAAAGEKKAEEATPATAVLKQRRASAEQRAKNDGELRYVMISVPVAEGVSFDWTVDDKLYSFKAPEDARVGEEHEFTFRESDAITKTDGRARAKAEKEARAVQAEKERKLAELAEQADLRYVTIAVPVVGGVAFDWTVDDKVYTFKAPGLSSVGEEHEFSFRESDSHEHMAKVKNSPEGSKRSIFGKNKSSKAVKGGDVANVVAVDEVRPMTPEEGDSTHAPQARVEPMVESCGDLEMEELEDL